MIGLDVVRLKSIMLKIAGLKSETGRKKKRKNKTERQKALTVRAKGRMIQILFIKVLWNPKPFFQERCWWGPTGQRPLAAGGNLKKVGARPQAPPRKLFSKSFL
ncbi:MAG: hypothetical protein IJW40_07960, partial [Clostridia bacterium]|nr:hypothetical protein [Clostridia bacterium]